MSDSKKYYGPYILYDGGDYSDQPTLKDALSAADDAIDEQKFRCDPEWPEDVENIAIYSLTAQQKSDGIAEIDMGLLDAAYETRECNRRPVPEEYAGCCDYFCDYEMVKVNHE